MFTKKMGGCGLNLLRQRRDWKQCMPHSHLSALIPGLELLVERPQAASSVGLVRAYLSHALLGQGLS